jgi:hypothetical protein
LRRAALVTLFAAATTLSASAFEDPAAARAEPREWDVANYDDCMAYLLADYQSGKRTFQEYNADANTCCWTSGGVVSEEQLCVAPTGEQAQEAEREPATPAPASPEVGMLPDGGMTLYMPPPVAPAGPAGPRPSEAVLIP